MNTNKDIKSAIGWNQINLNVLGIWPEPTTSESRFSKYKFLVPVTLIFTFITIPQVTNLFLLNGDLGLIMENLCVANIPAATAILKILFTWYRREDLKPLIESFYDDWNGMKTKEERTTMTNCAKVSKRISIWCTVLTQGMLFCFFVLRAIVIHNCEQCKTMHSRLIFYPGHFPYDVRPTLILVLTNVIQGCAAFSATCAYSSVDAFIAMLVLHMCGQFENLGRRVEKMMDMKNGNGGEDEMQKEMTWIVERHEHLSWIARKINKCFSTLMLMQVVLCTFELCLQGFMLSTVTNSDHEGLFAIPVRPELLVVVNFVFLIVFVQFLIIHIYLYCYVGELLLVQSNGMSISAYNSNWFNAPPKKAKCLLFIMNRCSRPLCLNAGKFGTFSMELFSAIIKSAMGYLSVLLTVSSDN